MSECRYSVKFINIFLVVYLLFVLILIFFTPFSQTEANILFSQHKTIETEIIQFIYSYIPDYWAMRLPFFGISLLMLYFYKQILKPYFKIGDNYYNLALFIFLLVPGIALSFIIVNYATVPIFLTILALYANLRKNYILFLLSLVLLLFTHSAQFVVYLAIALYGYGKKERFYFTIGVAFTIIASIVASYDIDGVPKGHFVQLLGIYASILSPILFLVVLYTIYRTAIKGTKDLLWYIVTTALAVSVLLSIRQAIKITDFAPFVAISIPLVIVQLRDSLAIRLKEFRGFHYFVCNAVLLVLFLETSAIFLHYPLYKYTQFKELLFETSMYEIPQSVKELKKSGKVCKDEISNHDSTLYKYYGITRCQK